MVPEARLEPQQSGLSPTTGGWFVLNLRDAAWDTHDAFGGDCWLEGDGDARFAQVGFHVRVLEPGQPNGMYHADSEQEDFLVVAGECVVLIEGEERRLETWDFVHCPPGTGHIFVGAGEGPCVIVMVGARNPEKTLRYPVSELARRYGASVETETDSPREAYASYADETLARPPGWDRLPWA